MNKDNPLPHNTINHPPYILIGSSYAFHCLSHRQKLKTKDSLEVKSALYITSALSCKFLHSFVKTTIKKKKTNNVSQQQKLSLVNFINNEGKGKCLFFFLFLILPIRKLIHILMNRRMYSEDVFSITVKWEMYMRLAKCIQLEQQTHCKAVAPGRLIHPEHNRSTLVWLSLDHPSSAYE